jgi:hypothetical protein
MTRKIGENDRPRRRRRGAVAALAVAIVVSALAINGCVRGGVALRHVLSARALSDSNNDHGGDGDERGYDERAMQLHMHERRLALLNESTVVNYRGIYHHFDDDMVMTVRGAPWLDGVGAYCPYHNSSTRDEYLRIFAGDDTDETNAAEGGGRGGYVVLSGEFWGTFCCALWGFLETGGNLRHVLMHPFDSNWGEFSDYVPNRTVDWGYHGDCREDGDDDDRKYWEYLNHPNLSAVFTVQHQWFDHPKVHSVPLGPHSGDQATAALRSGFTDRNNSLFLSLSDYEHRVGITERVVANFGGTIANHYHDGTDYYEMLRTSKFVLCPSGLGWDTYRAWEALVMGAIPILETYRRKDGLYRAYDDLPVLWVEHFDNVTPELLEREYPRILMGAREYVFEKLTNRWWTDLINSYRGL